MSIIKNLSEHKASQCHVIIHENGIIEFISYTTSVILAKKLLKNEYDLSCSGTYSQTTRKQISWFLREYFPNISYYDIKSIADTEKTIKTCK